MATTRTETAPPKPDVYVVEDNFHARVGKGELVLPLKIGYKKFKELMAASTDSPLEDLEMFVTEFGNAATKRALDEADDVVQLYAVSGIYFSKFRELAAARMGELRASSGI